MHPSFASPLELPATRIDVFAKCYDIALIGAGMTGFIHAFLQDQWRRGTLATFGRWAVATRFGSGPRLD